MNTLSLTKTSIAALPYSPNKAVIYKDAELSCLVLRVTASTKIFAFDRRLRKKRIWVKIGDATAINPIVARKKAQELNALVAQGIDPTAKEKDEKEKVRGVTLKDLWVMFKGKRNLKPRTVYDYEQRLNNIFHEWLDKPIMEITPNMVMAKHGEIGGAYANGCMRILRSLFNFAIAIYKDDEGRPLLQYNPVRVISESKTWFPQRRRTGHVKPSQVAKWVEEIRKVDNETVRDYLLVMVITGLRKTELKNLAWSQVDFAEQTLIFDESKNSRFTGEPFVLPMSRQLLQLLKARRKTIPDSCTWVFPGEGRDGNLKPFDGYWKYLHKVHATTGIYFGLHDLRRTFSTTAEGLDLPYLQLKRLLNHKMTNDVTAGYVIGHIERLRKGAQQIADAILGR